MILGFGPLISAQSSCRAKDIVQFYIYKDKMFPCFPVTQTWEWGGEADD